MGRRRGHGLTKWRRLRYARQAHDDTLLKLATRIQAGQCSGLANCSRRSNQTGEAGHRTKKLGRVPARV
jgi:hypothetical protein